MINAIVSLFDRSQFIAKQLQEPYTPYTHTLTMMLAAKRVVIRCRIPLIFHSAYGGL